MIDCSPVVIVIVSYSYMMISYNISRANLSVAISITPGKKAPTISPLEGSVYGDCESCCPSLHAVVCCTTHMMMTQ